MSRPLLFVTGHAPDDRLGAFALLSEREDAEFALFGGRLAHGHSGTPAGARQPRFPARRIVQREAYRLAASGRYRAVVCGTGGRVALPAAWAGARAARVPFVLWASMWAHPLSAAHTLSYIPLLALYRSADAVVTYGEHVSAYVRAHGARNVHVARQAVDNDFWAAAAEPAYAAWDSTGAARFLFVGRAERGKGAHVLRAAWAEMHTIESQVALLVVGSAQGTLDSGRVAYSPPVDARRMRNFYTAADVLVMPSVRTRTFREPWGLVAKEAMNRSLPVIATDEVGAVAGGLLRHGRNALVVPAGDPGALADAMRSLADDRERRDRLGAAGLEDVGTYTYEAWVNGFSQALASLDVSCDPADSLRA